MSQPIHHALRTRLSSSVVAGLLVFASVLTLVPAAHAESSATVVVDTPTNDDDAPSPPARGLPGAPKFEEEGEPPLPPLAVCIATEAYAFFGCAAGVVLIAFGVFTLGISTVFASTPLPFGICGIGLGALSLAQAVYFAIGAPIQYFLDVTDLDLGIAPEGASPKEDGTPDDKRRNPPAKKETPPLIVMAF